MRFRPIHLSLLIFQFALLNIIIPGHRRGIVPLESVDQSPTERAGSACCCGEDSPAPTSPAASERAKSAPMDPARNCAICDFAAHMMTAPPFEISLPRLELLCLAVNESAVDRVLRIVAVPFDSRGPPAA